VAFDALAVEPGDSMAEKADHRRLPLVCEHLGVGQPRGVIDSDMDLVVANTEVERPCCRSPVMR